MRVRDKTNSYRKLKVLMFYSFLSSWKKIRKKISRGYAAPALYARGLSWSIVFRLRDYYSSAGRAPVFFSSS